MREDLCVPHLTAAKRQDGDMGVILSDLQIAHIFAHAGDSLVDVLEMPKDQLLRLVAHGVSVARTTAATSSTASGFIWGPIGRLSTVSAISSASG